MSWTAGCLLAGSALALGQALQVNNGFLHPTAFAWLVAALALATGAAITARGSRMDAAARTILPYGLLGGVLVQCGQLLAAPPLMYANIRRGVDDPTLFAITIALALLACFAIIPERLRRIRIATFSIFVVLHAALGIWAIRTVPHPDIDVVVVQQKAIDKLAVGRSPYSLTFRDIYRSNPEFYAEGMSSGTRVQFGLPYPPLTLAFIAPADWLFGDLRFAQIIALSAAALLIASLGWTPHAMLGGAVLLTTPRVLFQLEQGWTEPFAIFLVALATALIWRRSANFPVALGLSMAIKQYLAVAVLMMPIVPLPRGMPRLRAARIAIGTGAAVTLPFALWDPGGFINSVVLLQFREPFRQESLSVLAWLAGHEIYLPTIATTAVAGTLAAAAAIVMLPRSAGGFAAGMMLIAFALFAFGKKAFCNYYFFVLGAMALAIATAGEDCSHESGGVRDAGPP
jgi:hypothetical protein